MIGRTLYDAALAGGAQALGQPIGSLAVGRRADLLVLDGNDPYLASAEGDALLNRWLFAGGDRQQQNQTEEESFHGCPKASGKKGPALNASRAGPLSQAL